MSHSPQSPALRTVALASALLLAGLAAPAAGHAQAGAPERVLLNHIAVPSIARTKSDAATTSPTDPGIAGSVDAARALLGRTPAPVRREVDRVPAALDFPTGRQVDGERALLVQEARAETRRRR